MVFLIMMFSADRFFNNLREAKGWEPLDMPTVNTTLLKEEAYNKLAQVVRENINLPLLYKVMGLKDE